MANFDSSHKPRYALALLFGIGFAASFPPSPLDWLAWFTLAPLFKLLEAKSPSRAFGLGWVWGTAHFVAIVYWIVVAVGHYGKLSFLTSIVPMLLLAFYLGLYPAVFCSALVLLRRTQLSIIWIPFAWVALEYARANLFTGFPWCLVGYTQYNHPLFIQVASLFGVYGLSFAVVLINWFCYQIFLSEDRGSPGRLVTRTLIAFFCVLGILWYGYYQLGSCTHVSNKGNKRLRIAIIQPSIDQSVKWDPRFQTKTMELYENLTTNVAPFKPDLIIWPETATPFFFQSNKNLSRRILGLARELGCPILFGSPAYQETAPGTKYFNRAYLLKPEGGVPQYYDKVHLVPFGEYIPAKKLLSFIGKLVPGAGDFMAGSSIAPLNLDGIDLGVLICFEAIFPEISISEARQGAKFLVNLTNDAWFGKTSAPYQHLAMSVFRAVENRIPLVRAANTGFSAIVDCSGKIQKKSRLFAQEVIVGTITVMRSSRPTFYARYGDIFAQCATFLSVLAFIVALTRRRK